ncbi:hypothetical protein HF923_01230 [Acidithiobacillus ferriphilus]|uniref:hypothetical protein n=1 Tax=Acidithiobacillus ferriphilus TaxID=1689834 RepID=UPI001C071A76|nr:hypothetical protein [Acidithiobacillus ferriphilus]MBU2844473.1 hypothetical protein [Acidithiobacillus ferriphilus]
MIAKAALLCASLITIIITCTIAQASTAPPPALPSHQAAHLSTTQMFRNFLQSGSICYGPHHTPRAHIVTITKRPVLAAIEAEAPIFAGLQKPPAAPPKP